VTGALRVNPIACSGHGLCAELLPELISLDEWGYPVIAGGPVPPRLARPARRAVTDCPALALALGPEPGSGPRAGIHHETGRSDSKRFQKKRRGKP
jgi:ferredoxin